MKSRKSRSAVLPFLFSIVALGAGAAVYKSANATILPPSVLVTSASLQENGSELVLRFEDREDTHGVCDFFVKRFQYLAKPGLLMLDVDSQKPCQNDAIGKRSGNLKWTLPAELKGNGVLKVVLNHVRVGTATIDHGQVNFNNAR